MSSEPIWLDKFKYLQQEYLDHIVRRLNEEGFMTLAEEDEPEWVNIHEVMIPGLFKGNRVRLKEEQLFSYHAEELVKSYVWQGQAPVYYKLGDMRFKKWPCSTQELFIWISIKLWV